MAFLEIKNLKKDFGELSVLKGIDFSLEKGEVLAIIGPSGNGKTTLLRCLNFLETPDEGEIFVKGEKLFSPEYKDGLNEENIRKKRLHFGLVFQNFNLFPQYTVLRNVTLPMELLEKDKGSEGKTKAEIKAEATELLSKVGLSDKLDFYPHQLSGGQQQRVAIARALALKPDILCFDEPTSALDPMLTAEVLNVIKSLRTENMTMIVVTHEMAFAKEVATKVIYMEDGRIAESGSPKDIFENTKSKKLSEFINGISNI